MYGPTTQCSSKNVIKCFGCLSLSLTYVLSLNRSLINRLINDRLLDAWPTVIQTSPQLINYLAQNFNRPAPVAYRDPVIYIRSLECWEVTGWAL